MPCWEAILIKQFIIGITLSPLRKGGFRKSITTNSYHLQVHWAVDGIVRNASGFQNHGCLRNLYSLTTIILTAASIRANIITAAIHKTQLPLQPNIDAGDTITNIFVSYKFKTESEIFDLGMSTSGIKQKYKVSSRYSVVAEMIKDYTILKPVVIKEPSFLPKFRISKAITKFFLSFGNGNRTDAIWELLGMVKNRNFRSWLTSSK